MTGHSSTGKVDNQGDRGAWEVLRFRIQDSFNLDSPFFLMDVLFFIDLGHTYSFVLNLSVFLYSMKSKRRFCIFRGKWKPGEDRQFTGGPNGPKSQICLSKQTWASGWVRNEQILSFLPPLPSIFWNQWMSCFSCAIKKRQVLPRPGSGLLSWGGISSWEAQWWSEMLI